MNDADAIRRTVRRSTAVLVLAVSLLVGSLSFDARRWAMVLAAGATLYLAASLVYSPPAEFDGDGDDGGGDDAVGANRNGDDGDGGDDRTGAGDGADGRAPADGTT